MVFWMSIRIRLVLLFLICHAPLFGSELDIKDLNGFLCRTGMKFTFGENPEDEL